MSPSPLTGASLVDRLKSIRDFSLSHVQGGHRWKLRVIEDNLDGLIRDIFEAKLVMVVPEGCDPDATAALAEYAAPTPAPEPDAPEGPPQAPTLAALDGPWDDADGEADPEGRDVPGGQRETPGETPDAARRPKHPPRAAGGRR